MKRPLLEIRGLLFIALGLALIFGIFIRDPDFYFHLRAGHDILQQHAIPSTDPYSLLYQGGAWHAHEWLFEVFIYLLFTAFGYLGIKLFIAIMGISALLLVIRAIPQKHNLDLPVVLFVTPFLFPYLTPRPQLFTFVFFAFFLFTLLREKYQDDSRYLKWLPPIMAIWVNMHGAYLLGIATLLIFLCAETLHTLANHRFGQRRTRLRRLFITLLLVIGASLLNPWGIEHWLFPFQLMDNSAVSLITEWQPINFSSLFARAYLALIGLFFLVYIYGPYRPNLSELLIPWGLIAASFLKMRHTPLACLALLPFFNLRLSALVTADSFISHPWIKPLHQRLSGGKQLGKREQLLNIIILTILLLLFALSYPAYHANDTARMNELVPVKATDFIEQSGLRGSMFNTYHYGGYLLFRLYPQQQVFIDIRGDMYGKRLMEEYRTIYNAKSGWQALLDKYTIDYIVCENDAPLVAAATAHDQFISLYHDDNSVVLVHNVPRYRTLIEHYHPSAN